MNIADQVALVGPRIREIRTQQRMTLAHLSRTTAISESTLSRLERGQRRPTLELLLALANGLGVPLDEFVGSPVQGVTRRSGTAVIPLTRRGGEIEAFKMLLPAKDPDAVLPGGRHAGFMWIYVLAGQLSLQLNDETVDLRPGEAAEFDTRVHHQLRNPGPATTELLALFGPHGERMTVRARTEPKV